jgi:hypothetical protein
MFAEPKVPIRLVLVVSAASELEVRDIGRAVLREGNDVVKLEEAGLLAATAGADECASALVTGPDGALHVSRDVTARAGWL